MTTLWWVWMIGGFTFMTGVSGVLAAMLYHDVTQQPTHHDNTNTQTP